MSTEFLNALRDALALDDGTLAQAVQRELDEMFDFGDVDPRPLIISDGDYFIPDAAELGETCLAVRVRKDELETLDRDSRVWTAITQKPRIRGQVVGIDKGKA